MGDLREFEETADLRKAYSKALRDLERAKSKKAELIQAAYDAARDVAGALSYKPVPKPHLAKNARGGETVVVLLSDWQLAKVTPSYTSEVCEQRVALLADKVRQLTAIQRADHPVNACKVYLLGDLIEGELIFPGQSHLIDASLFRQVMLDGPRILGDFLRAMLAEFATVEVVGVIGNHGSLGGRARRDYHPESNADAMMYETTRLMLANEERLGWDPNWVQGERKWYAIDAVGDKRFFMFHGDQIKGGFGGFPWYGFGKKLSGWTNMYGFDYAVSGHFHTPVRGLYAGGTVTHWGNGSTESDNTYAAEQLAASSKPSQWTLFVHPKRGVSAEYEVRL